SDPVGDRAVAPSSVDTPSLTAGAATISSGTIDNTVVGGTTPAAGSFSSLVVGDYAFPGVDGTTGQVLSTDGVGTLYWTDQASGGSGASNGMSPHVTPRVTAPSGAGLTLSTDTTLSLVASGGVEVVSETATIDAGTAAVISSGDTSLSVSPSGVSVEGSLSLTDGSVKALDQAYVTIGTAGESYAPLYLSSTTSRRGVSSLTLDEGSAVLSGGTLDLSVSSIDASGASLSAETLTTESLSVGTGFIVETDSISVDVPLFGDALSIDATTSLSLGTAGSSGPVSLSHPGVATHVLGDLQ
ncbi:hypothetical protein KIPB_014673, partial [Kipferlia bialata]